MNDQYTAQLLLGGLSASGHLRKGVLVCGITRAVNGNADIAYPTQWIEGDDIWGELFKRYPRNQVIRMPDVDVQYREIQAMRRFEKARRER